MHKHIKSTLIAFAVALALSSCVVSKKKYDQLALEKGQLQIAKNKCDSTFSSLDKKFRALSSEAEKLRNDTTTLGALIRKKNRAYSDLDKSYNMLLSNSATEAATLSRDLKRKEDELASLEANLNNTRLQNETLNNSLKTREARVVELEKILADKEKAVQDLKDKVNKALLGFKDQDLTVTIKNGKVYVSLSEQLLFKSGSFAVDPKGQEAIKKLATVLKANAEINVQVEGHTDDVPLIGNTPGMKDNWDLSVLRATSITRLLTTEGVPGACLVASGHGEYLPLETGKAPEIRQKNRRTDIILTPKLDELLKLLGN